MKRYVYPLDELTDNIDNYLDGYPDLVDGYIIKGKPYYAYLIHSDMSGIDVAYISDNMEKVVELSEFGTNHPVILATLFGYGEDEEELDDDEVIAYEKELHNKGITLIHDEDGGLIRVGDALIVDKPLDELLAELVAIYGFKYRSDVEDYILEKYADTIYEDLYINEKDDRPIFVINEDHTRF